MLHTQVICQLLAQKSHFSVTSACEFERQTETLTEPPDAQDLICAAEGGIQRDG